MASYFGAALRSDHPVESLANGFSAAANVATRDAPLPKLLDDGASTVTREVIRTLGKTGGPFVYIYQLRRRTRPFASNLGI